MDAKLHEFSSPSAGDTSVLPAYSHSLLSALFPSFMAGLFSPARAIYSGSEQNGLGVCILQTGVLSYHLSFTAPTEHDDKGSWILPLFTARIGHLWGLAQKP